MSIYTVKRARLLWLLAIIPIVALTVFGVKKGYEQVRYPRKYTELVEKYSGEYGVDENLMYAIISRESSFRPDAKSSAGALGLTQITPVTFRWLLSKTGESLEPEALYDPETSIRYGALLISMHLKEFGSTREAVAAYHAGRGAVNGWLKNPELSQDGKVLSSIPFGDTNRHVTSVMRAYQIYTKTESQNNHKGDKTT